MSRTPRVRAPRMTGRGWLNTDGPLDLADLRGRFVLLDFWTFCCLNCLHVLDELRPVEERFAEELVVIGVHSPKFVHEADPQALADAVVRYRVEHPVLDDPELVTWQAYTARAWPTLVLIDPEGYVVAQYAGEGHAHAIEALLEQLIAEHEERGTLQPGDSPYTAPPAIPGELAFPAAVVRRAGGTLLVVDSGHDEVVELDGEDVVRRFGGFREPNGVCLLDDVTAIVADTAAHELKRIDLDSGAVTTVAAGLNSPWDVEVYDGLVWVAMAGDHTLWTWDPMTGDATHVGGTRNEGLLDGTLAEAWFAQPSGLAADGERLWLVDAETSALRVIEDGQVRTVIGTGLFDFGHRDGAADQALLQHPLGIALLPDGSVAIADTYNGAVRRFDPTTGEVSTLASGLSEPSGVVVSDEGLVVVESAAHRLTTVRVDSAVDHQGFAQSTSRPVTDVASRTHLVVEFSPPPGQKVDERFGPAVQLHVSSTPPELLREGAGVTTELTRELVLDERIGDGVLHIAARAATCDVDDVHAVCRLHQQDWGVPIRLTGDAFDELRLSLGGVV